MRRLLTEVFVESGTKYVRRYPLLSLAFEAEAVKAIREGKLFGRTFMMLPSGDIVRRSEVTPYRQWQLRQEIRRDHPLPPGWEDEWADDLEPPAPVTYSIPPSSMVEQKRGWRLPLVVVLVLIAGVLWLTL